MLKMVLNSNEYKNLDAVGKEKKLLSFFHSSLFSNLSPDEKLILLQELENVEASKQKRESFEVVAHKPKDILMDAGLSINSKKIYFSEEILFEGMHEIYSTLTKTRFSEKIEGLNLFLLDCLFHEEFHILFNNCLLKCEQDVETLYRELKEYSVYMETHDISEKQQQEDIKMSFYRYITNPNEHYAFKYAYNNVINTFSSLNCTFGVDPNISSYLQDIEKLKKNTCLSFTYETGMNLNYNEIYEYLLDVWIQIFSNGMGYTKEEVVTDLSLTKTMMSQYHVY